MCGKHGMRIGGQHHWHYHTENWLEKKIAPRTWAFQYIQGKSRHTPAPYGSGMPIGSNLIWNIRAKQYAIKTGKDKYKLIMRGIKTQDAFRLPRKRWVVSGKRSKRLIW